MEGELAHLGMQEPLDLAGVDADLVRLPQLPQLRAAREGQLGESGGPGRRTAQGDDLTQVRGVDAGQLAVVLGRVERAG